MSGSLNKVMLIGNLGDDVKMVNFDDGGCLGRFPIATNESYNNKQTGEKVVNTEWHNVVVKNKAAEICAKYLKKGDKVVTSGGITGTISRVIDNDKVEVEIAENVTVEVVRGTGIQSLMNSQEVKK